MPTMNSIRLCITLRKRKSSVEQFVGRNRNEDSKAYLYMRQVKELKEKFTFKVAKNRNKTWLKQTESYCMDKVYMQDWRSYC